MLAQRATVLACGPSALSECCATKRTSSPNRELFERAVHDAVAMEIDLAAIGAQNEAAILRGQEPRDSSVVGHRVQLDVAASPANVIFEQPASCVERVADRDIDILMRMVRLGIAPDYDLAPRNFEIDTHPEQISLLAAGVLAFDNDAARYDPVKQVLELLGALTYSRRDGIRRVDMAESNLKWQLHRILHSVSTNVGDGERLAIEHAWRSGSNAISCHSMAHQQWDWSVSQEVSRHTTEKALS